jgi:hypothetical protein
MTTATPVGPPPVGPPPVGPSPVGPAATGPAGVAPARSSGRSTPRRLRTLQAVVVLTSLLLGLVIVFTALDRRSAIDRAERASDLVVATQELRAALGRADAASVNAFLAGGVDQPDQRRRYTDAIAEAAGRLGDAGQAAAGEEARAAVTRLQELLPIYNGRIETARANNRQQLPLGAAYLRNASALLHASEGAERSEATAGPAEPGEVGRQLERLEAAGHEAFRSVDDDLVGGLGIVLSAAILVTVLVFLWVQRWMSSRTRRTLNAGMAAASVLLVAGLLWVGSSTNASADAAAEATSTGYDELAALSAIRADAYDHQATATFALVDRGAREQKNAEAATAAQNVQARLDAAGTGLDATWSQYLAASDAATAQDSDGDYEGARSSFTASSEDPASIAGRFEAFDGEVLAEVEQAEQRLRRGLDDAEGPMDRVLIAGAVLGLVVAALAAWGIQQRINDYR